MKDQKVSEAETVKTLEDILEALRLLSRGHPRLLALKMDIANRLLRMIIDDVDTVAPGFEKEKRRALASSIAKDLYDKAVTTMTITREPGREA